MDKVNVLLSNSHESVSVYEHPYYKSVKNNDRKAYERWVSSEPNYQREKKSASWYGIKKLKKSISHGFDPKKSKVSFKIIQYSNDQNVIICHHGRHRMCLLAVLYPHCRLVLEKNILKSIIY